MQLLTEWCGHALFSATLKIRNVSFGHSIPKVDGFTESVLIVNPPNLYSAHDFMKRFFGTLKSFNGLRITP